VPATENVTLAVLAGGESSRMGVPKSHIEIDGKPILQWMLQRLAWPGPKMLVVSPGHENPPGHEIFTTQVSDPQSGRGPLRGVLTALENLKTPLVVIATVDMPGIEKSQLDWLIGALNARDDLQLLMPSRLVNGKVQAEPFPSVWRAGAIDAVRSQIEKGDPSVKMLGKSKVGSLILAPHSWAGSVWTNLNTPEELESFLAARSSQRF
jgi:molybdopterin-guanine dinucleotide biosynthesis protein A